MKAKYQIFKIKGKNDITVYYTYLKDEDILLITAFYKGGLYE